MLQKTVIARKNQIIVGIAYDYSTEEVEEFLLAKFFKDCGYTYLEIKKETFNTKGTGSLFLIRSNNIF
ncbi:MAG: hypothetical protein IKP77_01580 [Acholeplasmatales bacterium]|nr:hypothetical protein [Acholeplasmatales bacterium]